MRRKLRHLHHRLMITRHQQTRRIRILSRDPLMVPIMAFIVLLFATVAGLIWFLGGGNSLQPPPTDIVIISYDHQVQTVPSHEPTVGALLAKLKITINKGDVVEPSTDTKINQDDFRINIYRAVPVKIVDNDNATFGYTAATTPRSIAAQTGVTVYPEDGISTQPVTNILEEGTIGKVVVVDRSVPITLNMNGLTAATRTRAKTVGQLLTEKQIKIGKQDTVKPALNTPISPNLQVSIVHNGITIQNQTVAIDMPVQYITDPTLAYGTSAIRQAGSPGQEVLTYRVTVKGGEVVDRSLIQTVVTIQPVTQIVVRGNNLSGIKGDMALAGINPGDYNYADYVIEHESHWNPAALNAAGCAGLGQACPGSKLAAVCPNWQSDPVCQLRYFSGYATSRYGGWYGAYIHKLNYGWW